MIPKPRRASSPVRDAFRAALLAMGAAALVVPFVPGVARADPEAEIQAAREALNEAFAKRDLETISRYWAEDAVLSMGWTKINGRQDILEEHYRGLFETRPDVSLVRFPDEIRGVSAWELYYETGGWVESWTDEDGPVELMGRYLCLWRLVDGRWIQRSEVVAPHTCSGGAYCGPADTPRRHETVARAPTPERVRTVEALVDAFYASLRPTLDGDPDLGLHKGLFLPGARINVTWRNLKGELVASAEEYEAFADEWLGYYLGLPARIEEGERSVQTVGAASHVFSRWRIRPRATEPALAGGIVSFDLVFDDDRWWISALGWHDGDDGFPVTEVDFSRD